MISTLIPKVVVETIAHSVGIPKQDVSLHNTLAGDLRMDIHDLDELHYMLEDIFCCRITMLELAKSETVKDILQLIQNHCAVVQIAV